MNYKIRNITEADEKAVLEIFNYFVRNDFSAFAQDEVSPEFISRLREFNREFGFWVVEIEQKVIGFAILRLRYPFANMSNTGIISYFILPEFTRRGIGSKLLKTITQRAKRLKMDNLIAEISSRNKNSLEFHIKQGFKTCGKLKKVGKKFNQSFDVILVQKFIE